MPISRIPAEQIDVMYHNQIVGMQVAIAAIKVTIDAFKVAAVGMTDGQVGSMQTSVNALAALAVTAAGTSIGPN